LHKAATWKAAVSQRSSLDQALELEVPPGQDRIGVRPVKFNVLPECGLRKPATERADLAALTAAQRA
jgi:hypothetical protein